jgi:hypothetical protein
MQSIRRGLRLWVAIWLVVQVASLSALVPRDCCPAHRPAASPGKPSCHEEAAATRCPMRATDGTPCPMHRGDNSEAADTSRDRCAMRSSCTGPMAALLAQLSNQGILTDPFQVQPDRQASPAAPHRSVQLVTRLAPPDSPPPRA